MVFFTLLIAITIIDLNRDGIVTEDEIMTILDSFMMGPGPVSDERVFSSIFDFDRTLDIDEDNFVSPEEIGIAAGYSPEASIVTFDERLERMSWAVGKFF